jgi:hypothetical protein
MANNRSNMGQYLAPFEDRGNIIDGATGEVIQRKVQELTERKSFLDIYTGRKLEKEIAIDPDKEGLTIGQILVGLTVKDPVEQAKLYQLYTGTPPKDLSEYLNGTATIRGILIESHEAFQDKATGEDREGYNYLLMLTDEMKEIKVNGKIVKIPVVLKTSATQPIKMLLGFARSYGWGIWKEPLTFSFSGSKAEGYFARLFEG